MSNSLWCLLTGVMLSVFGVSQMLTAIIMGRKFKPMFPLLAYWWVRAGVTLLGVVLTVMPLLMPAAQGYEWFAMLGALAVITIVLS